MDVKTVFQNRYLEEDIYIEQLMGFTSDDGDHRICKLQKSIYRLKQASQSWNHHFDEAIKSFDFIKNEKKSYVYKRISGSAITFLILYVDDILLIGNDIPHADHGQKMVVQEILYERPRGSILYSQNKGL